MILELVTSDLENADLVIIGSILRGLQAGGEQLGGHQGARMLIGLLGEAIGDEAERRAVALAACLGDGSPVATANDRRIARIEIGDEMLPFADVEAVGRIVQRIIADLEERNGRYAGALRTWRTIELDLREEYTRRLRRAIGRVQKGVLN